MASLFNELSLPIEIVHYLKALGQMMNLREQDHSVDADVDTTCGTADWDFASLSTEHSPRRLRAFIRSMNEKLHLIHNIELDFAEGEDFLFRPGHAWELACMDEDDGTSNPDERTDCERYCRSLCEINKCFRQLRQSLLKLRTTTPLASGRVIVGSRIISALARTEARAILHEAFPKLNEITAINDFRGERFIKIGAGHWALKYTGEVVYRPRDGMHRHMCDSDPETGLSIGRQ